MPRGMVWNWAIRLVVLATAGSAMGQAALPKPLENLVVVEAEDSVDAQGTPVSGARDKRSDMVFYNGNENASGGAYITPVKSPYRMYEMLPKPVEAFAEAPIPFAGRWRAHVRYAVTPEFLGNMAYRKATETVRHFRPFAPFKVRIGEREFACGEDQSRGEAFRWTRFALELPAGRVPIRFIMADLAGPDCIVFTPNADYLPEVGDYAGPLWLRFRALDGPTVPFYVRVRSHVNPYAGEVKEAGFLFKDEVTLVEQEANKMRAETGRLLSVGDWTPWVRTHSATTRLWYALAMFMPGPGRVDGGTRKYGFNRLKAAYQAAVRPDERFLLNEGIEETGDERGVRILMPSGQGLDALRQVKGFTQWADYRLSLVSALGVKPDEGPRRIRVFTDAGAYVLRDVDAIIESCRLLGFNGLDLGHNVMPADEVWKRIQAAGFTWTQAHHLAPTYAVKEWLNAPKAPAPGQAMQQAVDAFWYEKSMERVRKLWENRPQRPLMLLANLVDEPGPTPHYLMINAIPQLKTCFHDFLRENGATPELFGKRNWDEVEAVGYLRRKSPNLESLLKDFGVEIQYVTLSGKGRADDDAPPEVLDGPEPKEADRPPDPRSGTRPTARTVRAPVVTGLPEADRNEKRLYYWTQRFRSFFTRRFYGQTARAVMDLSAQGWFRPDVLATPNFQAAPIMETRMWDGGLHLLEWADDNTSNCLMVEDWINDPYRVAFGFNLLNAAARKSGPSLAYLIVGDRHFRRRYLSGLAMGVQTFVDYSYGPLVIKGPAWGSNPDYVRDWAEMLRWTRRCEDDLLATRLRPAETALLIANSSEINSAYYTAMKVEANLKGRAFAGRSLFRRAGIAAALLDAGVPFEIVFEEEAADGRTLDRFKALYVVDTHVAANAQAAIKAWVRKGGTLWADHAALGRDEFDQSADTMNEVFGLTARGDLPDSAFEAEKDALPQTLRVENGEGLEEATFGGSFFRPNWTVSTAKVLARFADGAPALLLNRYGGGRALLLGCSVMSLSPFAEQSDTLPDFHRARRVVTLAADMGGAARHARLSLSRVSAFVRDGPSQTVLVLLNSLNGPASDLAVTLRLPNAPRTAFDGRGLEVPFEWDGREAAFTCNIAADDGHVIIFRW